MKKLGKAVTLLVALVVLPLPAGCFGGMHLSGHVRNFNEDISDNKWWQETWFLAMLIIPVYELAWLGDILIFNSIEFWSDGDNPISSPSASVRTFDVGGRTFTFERVGESRTVEVRVDRGGVPVERLRIDADGVERLPLPVGG